MKRRYADRRNNTDILDKEIIIKRIDEDFFKGYISYLNIKKVKKKWIVDEENRCILANNYVWFNIYPDDQNYCINAMLDDKENIIQWYFDVAKNIGVEDGVPYEDDLYLDVVIVANGKINLLDEDELDEALNNNYITKDDYHLAYKVREYILDTYGENIPVLEELTNKLLQKIKE